ncbi:MAG: caspase family protein [Hyphomicrobiaceae bacterium]
MTATRPMLRRTRSVGVFAQALLAFILALALPVASAGAENRIALVIGNSAYTKSPLANPVNDARAIAESLKRSGFGVTLTLDADLQAMRRAILAFGRALRESDSVGVFYFAGHGVQVDGENYLIPVGADIDEAREVAIEGVGLSELLKTMERAESRLNIAILDACRDNPYPSTTRSVSGGLASVEAPAGTFIAFATAPGQVALDGAGGNSPYSAALATHIVEVGISLEETFRRTRRDVLAATQSKQVPWEHSSLTGEFFFRPKMAAPDRSPDAEAGLDGPNLVELAAWQRIRSSKDRAVLEDYLQRFPDGMFAEVVQLRLNRLGTPQSPWSWIVTGSTATATMRSEQTDTYEDALEIETKATGYADYARAAVLYGRAAERGLPAAMHRLARLYEKGSGVAHDSGKAAELYRHAAEQGYAPSMTALGALHEYGQGVAPNLTEAARLYRRGAEAGDAAGMASYAYLLSQGKGVARDAKSARSWYQQAADRGDRRAMFNLALMLQRGEGGAPDRVAALRLLQLAAERGHAGAQRELAYHFDEGRGVARSAEKAAEYLLAALASGSKEIAEEVQRRPGVWSYATRRAVQARLRARGLYSGAPHGIFNRATKTALQRVASGT